MPSSNSSSESLQPASPRHDKLTRRLLEVDIGIDEIELALEFKCLDDDPDAPPSIERQLLDRLSDPNFAFVAGHPVAITTHMKALGITWPQIIDLKRKKDIVLALAKSGERIGRVVDGLGEMAEPRWRICSTCGGEGEIENRDGDPLPTDEGEEPIYPMAPCPELCQNGKVRVGGNLDAAKLFLGAHGIGPKGGASGQPTINVTAQAQAGARADANGDRKAQQQETVTGRVQDVLEGRSRPE